MPKVNIRKYFYEKIIIDKLNTCLTFHLEKSKKDCKLFCYIPRLTEEHEKVHVCSKLQEDYFPRQSVLRQRTKYGNLKFFKSYPLSYMKFGINFETVNIFYMPYFIPDGKRFLVCLKENELFKKLHLIMKKVLPEELISNILSYVDDFTLYSLVFREITQEFIEFKVYIKDVYFEKTTFEEKCERLMNFIKCDIKEAKTFLRIQDEIGNNVLPKI